MELKWLPIECAPRTGETVILCAVPQKGEWGIDGHLILADIVTVGNFRRDDKDKVNGGSFNVPSHCWGVKWTHWMPLPPSPYVQPA